MLYVCLFCFHNPHATLFILRHCRYGAVYERILHSKMNGNRLLYQKFSSNIRFRFPYRVSIICIRNEWMISSFFKRPPPPSPPSFSGGVFSGTFLFLCLAVWLIHLSVALLAKQTQFECLLTNIFFLLIFVVCGCTKKNFISLRVH